MKAGFTVRHLLRHNNTPQGCSNKTFARCGNILGWPTIKTEEEVLHMMNCVQLSAPTSVEFSLHCLAKRNIRTRSCYVCFRSSDCKARWTPKLRTSMIIDDVTYFRELPTKSSFAKYRLHRVHCVTDYGITLMQFLQSNKTFRIWFLLACLTYCCTNCRC
jgi:hypothetical protein